MEVILLERIRKLGQMGDVVKVKNGFARNFLLPTGKAMRANKANLAQFEAQRAQLEARNLELKTEAENVHEKLDGRSFIIIRQAGDTGQLYGSVSTRDIAELITADGCSIERGQVSLDKPIKILGLHPLKITLHPEVESSVTVNVARSEEEAELQAAGKDISTLQDDEDEEEGIDASEVFEDEALASSAEQDLSEDDGADSEAASKADEAAPENAEKTD